MSDAEKMRSTARELRASAQRIRHEGREGWLRLAMAYEALAADHDAHAARLEEEA